MKLSDWAKKQGVSYQTAWNWWKAGKLPVEAEQLPTGTIIVKEKSGRETYTAIYARVSSNDQKADLDGQVSRCVEYANENGLPVDLSIKEIGSGLNGKRPKLLKLLSNPEIDTIVVEHKDRLMRFGFEYIESSLKARGAKVFVVDESELQDDLVQDMISILTSFCTRLYGRRSAKNRAKKIIEQCNKV